MTPAPLVTLAALGFIAGIVLGPRHPRLWLALTLIGTLSGLASALLVLGGGPDWEWRSEFLVGGEALHLRLDGLSGFFLILLNVVGGTGALYAREYWSDEQHADSAPRGRLWWSAMILCMAFVLL